MSKLGAHIGAPEAVDTDRNPIHARRSQPRGNTPAAQRGTANPPILPYTERRSDCGLKRAVRCGSRRSREIESRNQGSTELYPRPNPPLADCPRSPQGQLVAQCRAVGASRVYAK
jgi:hypothetical protein